MVIEADSGLKCSEWFARWDPDTCSWKTSQACLFGGWIGYSGTWPRAGTMRTGIAYRRPQLAPLTSVTGCSLWPTATAADASGHAQVAEHKTPGQTGGTTLAGAVRRWPTPTSSMMTLGDMEQARFSGMDARRPTYAEANRFPTPTAFDAIPATGPRNLDGKRHGGGNKPGLRHLALLPTPNAQDWKSGKTVSDYGNSRPLRERVNGQLNPTWVEWLMGFPLGWTESEPSATP